MGIVADKLANEQQAKKAQAYDSLVQNQRDEKLARLGHKAGAGQAYKQMVPELEQANYRANRAESGLAQILSAGSEIASGGMNVPNESAGLAGMMGAV